MSGVSVGRLLMLILKVMFPASSFETSTLVMSGAFGFSPVESGKLWEFDDARAVLPSATVGSATSAMPSATSSKNRSFTKPPSCR
jgi:hypothetical protein